MCADTGPAHGLGVCVSLCARASECAGSACVCMHTRVRLFPCVGTCASECVHVCLCVCASECVRVCASECACMCPRGAWTAPSVQTVPFPGPCALSPRLR